MTVLDLVFMGSPEFAVPSFEAVRARHRVVLAVTQPDKPAGRGQHLSAPAIKRAAEAAGVPVLQPRSVRPPEVAAALAATGARLAVVVAYGKILPPAVLTAFPLGCVNVHGSLLPAYRGAAPIQWALIRGEATTGVTIMQLDEGMDTGPMLLRRELAIREDDNVERLAARLAPLGADALLEVLDQLEAGTARPRAQDAAAATMAPMLARADGVVDFATPATAVAGRIRGVDPWPGAVATLAGRTVKLFGARRTAGQGAPGAILAIDEAGLTVACGEGAVVIGEIQAEGKRRIGAAEFARGQRLQLGAVLTRAVLPE